MLTIKFPGHPTAQAVILEEPVGGVSGIVECEVCNCCMALTVPEIDDIADVIEFFIKSHHCELLAREKDVIAFAERLSKGIPNASVRVKKGKKTIREF